MSNPTLCHCHLCKQYLPPDYFYTDRTRTCQRSSRCKNCEHERSLRRFGGRLQ